MSVPPKLRQITFREWLETYAPDMDETDSPFRTLSDPLTLDDPQHVWTLVEGDEGCRFIVPGRAFVNRLRYAVTPLPWTAGDNVIVWFDDECSVCGAP